MRPVGVSKGRREICWQFGDVRSVFAVMVAREGHLHGGKWATAAYSSRNACARRYAHRIVLVAKKATPACAMSLAAYKWASRIIALGWRWHIERARAKAGENERPICQLAYFRASSA